MRLKRRPREEERALTRATLPAVLLPEGPSADAPGLSARAALRVADVYACVRLLAGVASSLPLVSYRRTPEGRQRHEGRLAELLARPWPGATTSDLVGSIVTSLLLHGDAFVGLYRDGAGRIGQLGLLAPEAVEVRLEGGALHYLLLTGDGVARLTEADVVHVRSPLSLDGLRGCSPIRWCATALGAAGELARHAHNFAARGARPGALVLLDKDVTADQATRDGVREELALTHGGAASGGVIVLGGGATRFEPLTLSMVEAEFVAQRNFSAVEIARLFGVPAAMLDLPSGDSTTYANAETRAADLLKFGLGPWLSALERALSAHRELSVGTEYVEFLYDGLLRPDAKTRAEVFRLALDPATGWMSRAEVRRLENLRAEPEAPDA